MRCSFLPNLLSSQSFPWKRPEWHLTLRKHDFNLYHIISYHIILYCIILYYIILYHIILYHTILYYIMLYYIILYYIILCYIIIYHIILCYIILYCIVLYYIISHHLICFYLLEFNSIFLIGEQSGTTREDCDYTTISDYVIIEVLFTSRICYDIRFVHYCPLISSNYSWLG